MSERAQKAISLFFVLLMITSMVAYTVSILGTG